ncbi:MAG: hypothetical protein IJT83_09825 [Victivallales bacterium]|nr:hypothetical protein [Victivallales bacterium]
MNTLEGIDLCKSCGRALTETEMERLREISSRLNLRSDDALWPLLAAMEYQRVYYETLPEKIANASREVMDNITSVANKVTAASQAKLTESVVKEAHYLARTTNYAQITTMVFFSVVGVLLFGSLMFWAGHQIGAKVTMPLPEFMCMPSGWLISGCSAMGGLFCLYETVKKLFVEESGWWKYAIVAFLLLFIAVQALKMAL